MRRCGYDPLCGARVEYVITWSDESLSDGCAKHVAQARAESPTRDQIVAVRSCSDGDVHETGYVIR